jgi:hypothetical protein
MANDVVAINDQLVPSYLQAYVEQAANVAHDEFAAPGGAPIGVVSIKGSRWKGKIGPTEPVLLADAEGHALPYFDVIIVAARGGSDTTSDVAKVYYAEDFEEGSDGAPDCSSDDGLVPDPTSPHPQSKTCAECMWNKWGSGKQGKGKRCADVKKIAIVPATDPENERFGGPMLLRLPPASLGPIEEYRQTLRKMAPPRPMNAVVTRLSFDTRVAYPKVTFEPRGWLSEVQNAWMLHWREQDHTKRVLGTDRESVAGPSAFSREEVVTASTFASPTPVPPPSAAVQAQEAAAAVDTAKRAAAAAALARARAAAASKAPPPAAAPAATGTPIKPPPGAASAAAVVPPKPPTPPTPAAAVPPTPPKPPAPSAAELRAAAIAARKAELEAQMAALATEDADEEAEVIEEVPVDGVSDAEITSDDILGAIDAELSNIPD